MSDTQETFVLKPGMRIVATRSFNWVNKGDIFEIIFPDVIHTDRYNTLGYKRLGDPECTLYSDHDEFPCVESLSNYNPIT